MFEREDCVTFVITMWGMYAMGGKCYGSNGSAVCEN